LTISTTHRPATDLSYPLHKFHGNPQAVEIPAGMAHVFYPDASEDRCTAAVLLDIDPVALVRGREGPALGPAAPDRSTFKWPRQRRAPGVEAGDIRDIRRGRLPT